MADSAGKPTTIVLKSESGRYDEGRAAGAIEPGHIIERNASGEFVVNATAGVDNYMVAIEDALQGKTISDAYADDDLVRMWIFNKGDEGYLFLASGQNVANAAVLKVSTNGELIAQGGTGITICKALEAVDATAARKRIKVQFT